MQPRSPIRRPSSGRSRPGSNSCDRPTGPRGGHRPDAPRPPSPRSPRSRSCAQCCRSSARRPRWIEGRGARTRPAARTWYRARSVPTRRIRAAPSARRSRGTTARPPTPRPRSRPRRSRGRPPAAERRHGAPPSAGNRWGGAFERSAPPRLARTCRHCGPWRTAVASPNVPSAWFGPPTIADLAPSSASRPCRPTTP